MSDPTREAHAQRLHEMAKLWWSNIDAVDKDALLAGAAALRAPVSACLWTREDEIDGESWRSACGERWLFNNDGPAENKVRFCHGCGHPVQVAPETQE